MAAGPPRHEIGGETREQRRPEGAALGTGFCLCARHREGAKGGEAAGKTQPIQWHGAGLRGLGYDHAHEVVGDEQREKFALHQVRAFAAQGLKAEDGFQIVQAQFDAPAAQIGRRDFARRIRHGVEQGGHEGERAGAKTRLRDRDTYDAHDDLGRQVKECVRFTTVLSANTQARREGYFRIEWDLAAADDFKLADRLLKEAAELGPLPSDAWDSLATLSYGQFAFGFDRTDARDDLLRRAAERAGKLAPASDRAQLALALHFGRSPGKDDKAVQILRELAGREPTDKFILRQLSSVLGAKGRHEDTLATDDRAIALLSGDPIA